MTNKLNAESLNEIIDNSIFWVVGMYDDALGSEKSYQSEKKFVIDEVLKLAAASDPIGERGERNSKGVRECDVPAVAALSAYTLIESAMEKGAKTLDEKSAFALLAIVSGILEAATQDQGIPEEVTKAAEDLAAQALDIYQTAAKLLGGKA